MSSWEENIAALKAQGLEHVAFYGIGAGWVVPSDGSNVRQIIKVFSWLHVKRCSSLFTNFLSW